MKLSNIFFRISQVTTILMTLGWIAVLFTATFLKGGHPPLSAYVGMIVIVSSWILGSLGFLCGLAGMRGEYRSRARSLFLALNVGLLGFSVAINFV